MMLNPSPNADTAAVAALSAAKAVLCSKPEVKRQPIE